MESRCIAVFWDADLEVFVVLGDDDEPVGVGITAEDAVREAESALQPVEWDQYGGQWVVFDAQGFLLGSSYDSPEDARQDAVDRARRSATTTSAKEG